MNATERVLRLVLMVAVLIGGIVHVKLYDDGYRDIANYALGRSFLANAMASVGAFAFASPTSSDAAVFQQNLAPGGYTVVASGVSGSTGTAIAEIYDAIAAGTFTATSPRLINVSVLKPIVSGGSLTLGFTIGGSTAKTVLIRAIGPGLAAVGVTSGTLGDPQLTLFNSGSVAV